MYVNPKLKDNFAFVESSLEGREWFCGTEGGVTGADGQSSISILDELDHSSTDRISFPNFHNNPTTVLMTFPIEGLESSQGPDLEKNYPNISGWLKRVRAREAYIKAEERGGKTDLKAFVR